jgi:hypothetical protein
MALLALEQDMLPPPNDGFWKEPGASASIGRWETAGMKRRVGLSVQCDPKYLICVEAALHGVAAKVSVFKLGYDNSGLVPKA